MHLVSSNIKQSILWMDKAEEIWNYLKERFFQGDLLRISNLQMEAASMKQGESIVTEYFTKLRTVWDKLENFRPDPPCTCKTGCSCKVFTILNQRKVQDRAMQFLRGLNDQYGNIRSYVLLMDPTPPNSKIFSYVVQQESRVNWE